MKRFFALLLLLALLSTPALAQGGKQVWAGAGLSMPMGDFGDVAKSGLQFGGGFGFELTPAFTLGGEVFYDMFGLAEEYEDYLDSEGFGSVDFDIRITQYTLMARVDLMPALSSLYAKFNAGMYKASMSASAEGLSATIDDTDFGFGVGLGYQFFGAANTGGFVEAVYHNVPGSDETIEGVTYEGSATQWIDLRGGVVFNFPGL